jgi:hypothetical protein
VALQANLLARAPSDTGHTLPGVRRPWFLASVLLIALGLLCCHRLQWLRCCCACCSRPSWGSTPVWLASMAGESAIRCRPLCKGTSEIGCGGLTLRAWCLARASPWCWMPRLQRATSLQVALVFAGSGRCCGSGFQRGVVELLRALSGLLGQHDRDEAYKRRAWAVAPADSGRPVGSVRVRCGCLNVCLLAPYSGSSV